MKLYDLSIIEDSGQVTKSARLDIFNEKIEYYFDASLRDISLDDKYDAFVIAAVPFMIQNNDNLEVEGIVDEVLLHNLNTELLPALAKINGSTKSPLITSTSSETLEKKMNTIATGMSCGVDSFTTIINLKNSLKESFTSVTFLNAGSHGRYSSFSTKKIKDFRLENAREACQEMGLSLLEVESNISDLVRGSFQSSHSLTNLSCVYTIALHFDTYFYSSAYSKAQSVFKSGDTSNWDSLLIHHLSSSYLKIRTTSLGKTRYERTELISTSRVVQKYLDVCINSILAKEKGFQNCSECIKCVRTMITLELNTRLQQFDKVFDLENYQERKDNFIINRLLFKTRNPIDEELLKYLKNDRSIPLSFYIIGFSRLIKKKIKLGFESIKLNKDNSWS